MRYILMLALVLTCLSAAWAADDSVLLLWATDPLLPKAFEIIEAWGFTYKTVGFYWAKTKKAELFYNDRSFFMGLGFWTRANPEQCLLATRGKPRRRRADVPKLIVSPATALIPDAPALIVVPLKVCVALPVLV